MLLQLIKEWLKKRLGIHIDIIPERFIEFAKDGTLLAQILQNYNVITVEDLQLIEETSDPVIAYENYDNYIKKWLSDIDVELSENDIYEITHGDGTAAVTIFYEVHQKLENDKCLPVYTSKKHKFKVEKLSEHEMEDEHFETNPLCEPLLKRWDLIHWEKDHLTSMMLKYVKSREDYDEYLENKKVREHASFDKASPDIPESLDIATAERKTFTYDELIQQQKTAIEMQKFEPNIDEAKKIMKEIRRKNKKRAERNAFRVQLQHELLADVFKKIQETEELEFDKEVCEKLLKQSLHEKEIAEKLFSIRQQKERIIQNRRIQEEIEKKQKEEEFVRKLFEEEVEERLKYHDERMALINEHKRLYEEKLKQKALKHKKLCEEVMKDVVDMAIKSHEYKEMYGMEPSKYVKREWANLFVKQQPIFELVSQQELKQPPEDMTAEYEEIFRRALKRQDILDEQDIEDYIHFNNIWRINESLEEFVRAMELGMNVLGYIVHKLLLKKYPLPIPQKPSISPEIEISVCTNHMTDLSRLDFLQKLLDLRGVRVIKMEDAVNFCIQAYEQEQKTEFDEPFPEEEYLKELTPKKAKSDKTVKKGKKDKGDKKKGKKDKSSKKSKGSKKDKGSKKGNKSKEAKDKSEVIQATFEEKQAQTPRLFPWERIILSNKAKLGKIAKAKIEMGEEIEDVTFIDMFVEYLLSLQNLKGWVLINYPNTYEQAALLEQALTGKPVPQEYFDKVINKESLASVVVEEEESILSSTAEPIEVSLVEVQDILTAEREILDDRNVSVEVSNFPSIANESDIDSNITKKSKKIISKERIQKLLPDLKKLAYSSDEEEIEDVNKSTQLNSEMAKTCICICNTMGRKNIVDFGCSEEKQDVDKGETIQINKEIVQKTKEQKPKLKIQEPTPKTSSHEQSVDRKSLRDHQLDVIKTTGQQLMMRISGFDENEELKVSAALKENEHLSKMLTKDESDTGKVKLSHEETPVKMNLSESEQIKTLTEYENQNTTECVCYLTNKDNKTEENYQAGPLQIEEETQTEIIQLEENVVSVDDKPLERPIAEDICEMKRLSKIVPNPRPFEKEIYNTILTAYIKIQAKEEVDDEYRIPIFEEYEKKGGLEKFYCDQGCYYILEYEEFNSETIKCLAKMIIGDYSLPLKSSIEIFGERYKEAIFEIGDHKITKKGKEKKQKKKGKKKDKSKSSTKKSKSDTKPKKGEKGGKDKKSSKSSKKSNKSKKGKGKKEKKEKSQEILPVEHEDKEVQVPIVEEEEETEELLPEPRAGEPDWEYTDLPISQDNELTLAILWENTEQNYIKNFKDLFYNNRVLLNEIVPYLAKTKMKMTEFIARPDNKQYYLRQFQKTLNEIDLDMRSDAPTKSELYCRIDEFKEKLLGLCDSKMRESEEERKNYIKQNWLFYQFCQLTNNCGNAYQFEIDRFIDTLQFLSDYYISIITKSVKEGYEFHKEILSKYECNETISEKFNTIFIDTEIEFKHTPFHDYVEATCMTTLAFVDNMKSLAWKPFEDMKKIFEKEAEEKKPKKPWKKKGSKTQVKKFEPDEDVKENCDRIFEEWECALNGEIARMNIHLNMIKSEAFNRYEEIIKWIKKVFGEIYDDISIRYENELTSVHKACELLTQSVEDEVIIQPELTFEGDQLATIKVTLFPQSTSNIHEDYKSGCFKLEQIDFMVNILQDLAHSGYIMKNTFLLLVQDILYQDDYEEAVEIPQLWRNLSIKALNALLHKIFDDEEYLYWKDFIVCNLMVPFPTHKELLYVRQQFRNYDPHRTEIVTWEEFNRVDFWFSSEDINLHLLKSIIYKMYQTDEDKFNYTAMLLDFCKDEDSVCGFVKALELSLGKFICYDQELGAKFVEEVLEERLRHEEEVREHEETIHLAKKAISLLIDKIVEQREGDDGIQLTEIEDSELTVSLEKCESDVTGEASEGKILTEHKFSYIQIGFDAKDDTQLAYFLPLDLVLIIVSTIVPCNSKVKEVNDDSFKDKIVKIYEECRNEEFNGVVLTHEFLNCDKIKELFATTTKFSAHNPVKLVKQILYDPSETLTNPFEINEHDSKFSGSALN